MKTFAIAAILALISTATAHMEMTNPPPIRSKYNPFTTNIDYDMINPLDKSGSNFPCKGYHTLFDTPQGASVATWQPGETHTISLAGSATHNGGSCQVSISYDRGASFTVLKSWIGNCPLKPDWTFTLPAVMPKGEALFAWSWHNNIGNREMYMNCAHITIGGNSPGAITGRPSLFVANVGNGCSTIEGSDVLYPNPGPVVENTSARTAPPTGNCGSRKRSIHPLRV